MLANVSKISPSDSSFYLYLLKYSILMLHNLFKTTEFFPAKNCLPNQLCFHESCKQQNRYEQNIEMYLVYNEKLHVPNKHSSEKVIKGIFTLVLFHLCTTTSCCQKMTLFATHYTSGS